MVGFPGHFLAMYCRQASVLQEATGSPSKEHSDVLLLGKKSRSYILDQTNPCGTNKPHSGFDMNNN